ncbi:MAG: CHAT domain-containing protein, partial [Bacteroidales bacterium]
WNGEIFKLERELESHIQIIKKNYPSYYARKYEGKGIDISSLQNAISAAESIIEYTLSDSTLYVFILNQQGLSIFMQKPPACFFSAVPEFLTAIQAGLTVDANTQYHTFINHAYLLYEILIKPYSALLQTPKIIVIPEGILSHLPFEALLSKTVNQQIPDYRKLPYLMNDYCIRYAYVSTNLLIPEKKNTLFNKVAAFAPVTFKGTPGTLLGGLNLYPENLPDLPYSLEETRKIVRMTGGDLFEREKASESNFKQLAPNYRIIHLATHTWIDTLNPFFSKFVMYNQPDSIEDNLMSTYEISNLTLPASLVVLNSCNSGTGNAMAGEGVFNLARGFFYAGIPSVLATLWEVDDNIGSDIVQRFYRKLMRGIPADEALWESQREYLRDADRLKAHPYFWSPYGFVGQSKIIKIEQPARWGFLVLLATGVVLLAGMIWKTKRNKRLKVN